MFVIWAFLNETFCSKYMYKAKKHGLILQYQILVLEHLFDCRIIW